MKPSIFIDGEHGTTGLQIRHRLAARSDLEVLSIPHRHRRDAGARADLLNKADFAILCLPDDASREAAEMVADGDTRLIDASTAHRIHPGWEFGFAEMTGGQRERIAAARFVANPGCYSTGAIALLRPLTEAGLLAKDALTTINAVSGYTGGGKSLIERMTIEGREDAITAPHFLYATGLTHKHVPEITRHALLEQKPLFSPSVGRFPQGMLVQVPLHIATLSSGTTRARVHQVLADHYAGQDIVQVIPLRECDAVDRLDPAELAGQDIMRLFVFGNEEQVNLVAQLDNLGKGASGACVQDLDIMIGG